MKFRFLNIYVKRKEVKKKQIEKKSILRTKNEHKREAKK